MQHYMWKENRGESILSQLEAKKSSINTDASAMRPMKRIVHGSKMSGRVTFPTPKLLTELEIKEKNVSELSDPEAPNDLHNFSSLQPKLPVS